MKLSKKTKYALMAMIRLARHYQQGPMQIADLAQREGIPHKFLEAILLSLKNNGLLRSKKGKGGGYFLDRPPEKISVNSIVRVFEGTLAPVPCITIGRGTCPECGDDPACGIRMIMDEVHDAISHILDKATLAELITREDRARLQSRGALHYDI